MSVRLCDNSVGTSLQRITYVAYRALCLEGYLGFIGISRRFLQLAVDTASLVGAVKAGKAAACGFAHPSRSVQGAASPFNVQQDMRRCCAAVPDGVVRDTAFGAVVCIFCIAVGKHKMLGARSDAHPQTVSGQKTMGF